MRSRSSKKIKCSIVGLGWWGARMAEEVIGSGKFEVTHIYDTNETRTEEFSYKHKIRIARSVEAALTDDDINCVFIFSPNDCHRSHALLAAKAKKHIFLEKPIANTSQEGRSILEACRENAVTLAVAHNVRHYNIFKKAKELLLQQAIGDIVYVDCHRSRPIGLDIGETSWRFYRKSCNGGPLMQMAIHLLDTVNFLMDDRPTKIKTLAQKRLLKTENPESFSVSAETSRGILLHLFTSYILPETFYINIFGSRGVIYAEPFHGLFLQQKDGLQKKKMPFTKNNPEREEICAFYRAIQSGEEFTVPSPHQALENVVMIEEILSAS